ncbi:C25 family cysteine peptidase [Svornostia abyssi]|uniref:C25 family cysteine peptidase n=1 Tax=Svornostia abyssi TaxID=2898438 RepID=A0ABY5PHU6_9ACTN|nr:C25 family cysteine peptidase [Parviterribacteraceae bacterium J379]
MPSQSTPLRAGLVAVACALVALLATPALSSAASTPKPLATALTALRTEAQTLPKAAKTRTRAAIARTAADVRAGRWCKAKRRLSTLRKGLRGRRAKGVPLKRRAALSSRALRVQALLLADTRTRRCGGRKTAGVGGASGGGARVLKSTPTELAVRVELPTPQLVPKTGGGKAYDQLVLPGLATTAPPGDPGVPSMAESFAIPEGAEVEVTKRSTEGYTLDGVDLYPAQEQPVDAINAQDPRFADKPFEIDRRVYASDASFPKTAATAAPLGELRDLTVGQLAMAAGQYQPKSKKLKVFTSVDMEIRFTGGTKTFGKPGIASPWETSFRKVYANALVNAATAFEHGPALSELLQPCGEEMLIITSPALRPAADTLASARSGKGIYTRVVETGAGTGKAGTTADQIRTFVQGRVANTNCIRPSYLLLFGNTANVPTFTGDPGIPNVPSDLDYALKIRELYLPNLAVGRIPAESLSVANTIVGKITGYIGSPPLTAAFYDRATVTSYFQTDTASDTQDDRGFTRTSEAVRNSLTAQGKTVNRVYTTGATNPLTYDTGDALPAAIKKPGFAWNGTGNDVRDQINEGRFFVMHRDHGGQFGVGHPDIDSTQINAMTNGGMLPVFFSINCSSGRFDSPGSPSFSENLLRRAGGGAVGVIGASRDSPSEVNNRFALGLVDAIYPSTLPFSGSTTPVRRMGEVLNLGKLHVILDSVSINQFYSDNGWGSATQDIRTENRLYQYFGDPSMEIRTQAPKSFGVISVELAGTAVKAFAPKSAAGAAATLLKDGVPIGRSLVAGDGSVIVNPLEDLGTGKLELVLDQDGFEKSPVLIRALLPANPAAASDAPPVAVPAAKPDLVITGIRVVSTAPRHTVVTVKNQGAAAAGPFTTAFLQIGDPASAQEVPSAGLAAGQSIDVAVKGIYDTPVRATVDSKGTVDESDETNNVFEDPNPFVP